MRKILFLAGMVLLCQQTIAQVTAADASIAKELVSKNISRLSMTESDLENSLVSATYTGSTGIRMVYLQQSLLGIPVYNEMLVLAFRGEQLVSSAGGRISSIEAKANSTTGRSTIDVRDAVRAALASAGLASTEEINILEEKNNKLDFGKLGVCYENITAEQIWVPVGKMVRLAWQVLVSPEKTDDMWLVRVDAANGNILGRDNLTTYDQWHKEEVSVLRTEPTAPRNWFISKQISQTLPIINGASYLVIKYPAESPQHPGGVASIHTDPWTMASGDAVTLKWHNNGTTDFNISRGNNVWATEDQASANQNTGLPATSSTGDPLTFNFVPDYSVNPTNATFQQFAITNLFYWNNIIHDISYLYGFDELSGNFQNSNMGRGGLGNDHVMALAQSGAGTNNANFNSPPDGQRGRMRMYLWTAPNPDRDGDLDNGIIVHEFGHGISTRLTGGPANSSCLQNAEQAGEGWSDYFALMYTTDWSTATVNDGPLPRGIGTYAANEPITANGIRSFPYSTDLSVNPRIYPASISAQEHVRGEYWCAALWEMTWEMIQLDGINPNLFNPNATGGNSAALRLVIEGMKLQPCSPGFIDARNAILRADTLLFGAHYSCAIWKAFAKRGMGRNASQGSSNNVNDQVPSFIVDNGFFVVNESAQTVTEGQNITYTNTVTAGNCSPMSNYFLTDTLPTNVTWISGGSYDAGNRTVTFGPVNLVSGQSQQFSFTVKVNPGTYFTPTLVLNEQVPGPGLPAGWTISPLSGNTWSISSVHSVSAPNSFFAVNAPVSTDMTLHTSATYSLLPNTVSNYSTLSFWHRFDTEEGWDGGVVEVSNNGGSSWVDLGSRMSFGKYNGSLGTGSPLANRAAFTGNSNGFMKTVVNLSSYAGQAIQIRFRFASDNNTAPTAGGWWVDDIEIRTEPAVYMKSNLFNQASQLQSVTDTIARILPAAAGCTPISVTAHPANANTCSGANASFSVSVTGTTPVYQWQVNNGSGFVNIPASAPYSGTNSATLTITGTNSGMNNYQYRVVISNTCTVPFNSGEATLLVGSTASILADPVSVSTCTGTNATFSVNATGAISYQWQVNTGNGFTDLPAAAPYSGVNTATLSITGVIPSMNNNQYRVVVGSCPSNINSATATLTVTNPVVISIQPESSSVCDQTAASFKVSATGTINSYQWQMSTDGGTSYNDIPGANSSQLLLPTVNLSQQGYWYRVLINSVCGNIISGAAMLTVNTVTSFTLGNIPASLCTSDTAITLTASIGGGLWSGNGVQSPMFLPSIAGQGAATVTYTITNASGCITSLSSVIQVKDCPERHITLDKQNSIIVYSNPNDGKFNIWIKTDLYSRLGMRVYNSEGQLMKTIEFTGLYYDKKIPVDLSRLAGGVYQLLLFNNESGKSSSKSVGIIISR